MKEVNSSHNKTLKHLKQLAASGKYRRKTQQTLLEGVHLCQSYLEQVGRPVSYIYTDHATEDPEVARIIQTCEDLSVSGVLLGESNFKSISAVENGVGLMFVVNTTTPEIPKNIQNTSLLLEDVQDPGNMGTILRTAAAAGIKEVYTSAGSASVWSPKVLRAGMGAHFALKIYENCDLNQLIQNSGIPVSATSLEATETIYQKDLTKPTAWLFGNEGSGVSSELLSLNVQKVIIPQNTEVESLNVAASVAVCLFEQARQQVYTKD